jgi:hypothetical protein
MNKNNKNTEKNNIKNYVIAFASIIAVILISVYLMSFFSPNKKVKVTENQISNTVNNQEENQNNNEVKTQNKLKTSASESDYEKLSTDFINVISTLDGNNIITPDYKNKDEFYKQSRIGQCNILTNYLSDNLAERHDCQKLPNITNDPTYSSTLITSKIEDIKVKSKVKLDDETFRFTYYIKVRFNLEQLKNHGEGSDGGTIKATSTEEFNDVYVDVKNNKIFKTNIDESMKNATILWDGKSYLNLDWQVAK